MPTDTLDTVWAYRQATQECRNRERMNAYVAKRDTARRYDTLARSIARAQQNVSVPTRWQHMQAVITERDVARMVAEDERNADT